MDLHLRFSHYLHSVSALSRTPLQQWYSITYMYWSIIGTLITVFVGTLVSYFTASKEDTYEAKLLHPLIVRCLNFMPGVPMEFKQPLPESTQDSMNSSQVTISPDVITVEVQEKINGLDNFAYEKDLGVTGNGEGDQKRTSQRINNMTLNGHLDTDAIEHLEMDEQQQKVEVSQDHRLRSSNSRRGSQIVEDAHYSPETTGVYKKYEMDC